MRLRDPNTRTIRRSIQLDRLTTELLWVLVGSTPPGLLPLQPAADRIGTQASSANEDSEDLAGRPREEKGRHSNPPQRRLSSADIGELPVARLAATVGRLDAGLLNYLDAEPELRRQLNQAIFAKIYVEDGPGIESELAEPFKSILGDEIAAATTANTELTEAEIDQRWTAIAADWNDSDPEPELVGASTRPHSARQGLNNDTLVDLQGRLSNPLPITETLVAQRSERVYGSCDGVETTHIRPSDYHPEPPREEKGRLSNPPQRRLSPTAVVDLVGAYRAGATINQLAVDFGIHRTTVTGHLDRHGVPRHSEQTAWDDEHLTRAAELYTTGSSLADVAHRFGIDSQTVANRFRRAGIPVRPRRGWTSPAHSEQDRR